MDETLLSEMAASKDDETAGVMQLRLHLMVGTLARLLGVAPIESCSFEFHLPGVGQADMILFHMGGGVTIVEAKGPLPNRTLVAGIGQLFMYEAGIRALRRPVFVNKVLCAPVAAQHCMPVWEACQVAGVKFVHLAPHSQMLCALAEEEALHGN